MIITYIDLDLNLNLSPKLDLKLDLDLDLGGKLQSNKIEFLTNQNIWCCIQVTNQNIWCRSNNFFFLPFVFDEKQDHSATDLATHALRGAIASINLDASKIDSVIIGNVAQTSADAAYLARHAGLKAGTAIATPALTINRLCGSGFQSVVNGVQEIVVGDANIVATGGTESMSQAPFAARGIRFGVALGKNPPFEDTLWSALTDSHVKLPMGITAENLAEKYNISRKETDEFSLSSQLKWAEAQKKGIFDSEITPITIKTKKGQEEFKVDEGPRPATTLEGLAKLKPVFKEGGTVTAGSASGITDGAGAVIIASEEAVRANNLKPLARIVSYHISGVDPKIMGIGPVPAIQGALKRAKLDLSQIDIIEINEAFAAQVLACQRELKFDMAKFNKNGGAISLGHPLGASGSRITAHLAHELNRTKSKYAIGAACIGGGQGIAIILENPNV